MDLSIDHHRQGDYAVMTLAGEIDVYTAPLLREKWIELLNAGEANFILDMTEVTFLDSTGLGVLVGGMKRIRSGDGDIRLVCNGEKILKVFRITGLTKVFPIYDTLADAVP